MSSGQKSTNRNGWYSIIRLLVLDNCKIGKLIGDGGKTKRYIEKETFTKITISHFIPSKGFAQPRTVEIFGTWISIFNAIKYMVYVTNTCNITLLEDSFNINQLKMLIQENLKPIKDIFVTFCPETLGNSTEKFIDLYSKNRDGLFFAINFTTQAFCFCDKVPIRVKYNIMLESDNDNKWELNNKSNCDANIKYYGRINNKNMNNYNNHKYRDICGCNNNNCDCNTSNTNIQQGNMNQNDNNNNITSQTVEALHNNKSISIVQNSADIRYILNQKKESNMKILLLVVNSNDTDILNSLTTSNIHNNDNIQNEIHNRIPNKAFLAKNIPNSNYDISSNDDNNIIEYKAPAPQNVNMNTNNPINFKENSKNVIQNNNIAIPKTSQKKIKNVHIKHNKDKKSKNCNNNNNNDSFIPD